MYQALLRDSSLFDLLLEFDRDLATEARRAGCGCGGVLHSAAYPRKPRGGPPGLGPEHAVRFSFCCGVEGCRRRVSPPSLRFLGRKVFWGVVVLLVPVLRQGPTPKRVERLWDQLEKKGIRPERLQLEWISSAQASRFQTSMEAIEKIRQTVTPEEIEETKKALSKNVLEAVINV